MINQPVKAMIVCAVLAAGLGSYLSNSKKRLSEIAGGSTTRPMSAPESETGSLAVVPGPASLAALPSFRGNTVEIRPDSGGQFHANVEIEGRILPMLVDTGATLVTLTYANADLIGYAPTPTDYKTEVLTANGKVLAAQVRLLDVRIASLVARDVPALVMPRQMTGTSLLGMSFLKKLNGFEVASGNLVLRP